MAVVATTAVDQRRAAAEGHFEAAAATVLEEAAAAVVAAADEGEVVEMAFHLQNHQNLPERQLHSSGQPATAFEVADPVVDEDDAASSSWENALLPGKDCDHRERAEVEAENPEAGSPLPRLAAVAPHQAAKWAAAAELRAPAAAAAGTENRALEQAAAKSKAAAPLLLLPSLPLPWP